MIVISVAPFRAVILKLKNYCNLLCVVIIKDNRNYFNNFKILTIIIAGDFLISRLDSPISRLMGNCEKF